MSSFDSDVMEDLYYDEAEGAAFDPYDEYEEFAEHENDEFLSKVIGAAAPVLGGLLGGDEAEEFEGYDEAEEYEEYEEADEFEEEIEDLVDALEYAVADALAAEDTDEFFGNLLRNIGNIAKKAAPVIGKVARTIAPVAKAIPLPWTQAIGGVADVVGGLMADEADEFEAMDEFLDYAEYEGLDAAAPVIAGLHLRKAMPHIAQLPKAERKRIVHSVTQATRNVAHHQGVKAAARAVPGVVRTVQKAVRHGRIAPRTAAHAIEHTANRVAHSPQLAKKMAARAGTAAHHYGRPGHLGHPGQLRRHHHHGRPGYPYQNYYPQRHGHHAGARRRAGVYAPGSAPAAGRWSAGPGGAVPGYTAPGMARRKPGVSYVGKPAMSRTGRPATSRGGYGAGYAGPVCPICSGRRFRINTPVTITIHGQ